MRRPSESRVDRSTLSRSAALSLFAAGIASAAPLGAQTTLAPLRIGRGYRLGMSYSVTDLRILKNYIG